MPKSIVEPSLEVTEQKWIVSAINSSGSYEGMTFGGHAMIVVEGLYRETPSSLHIKNFVGQYDILAATTDLQEEAKALINIKGRYFVRCFESEKSSRPAGKEYHTLPHKSYVIDEPSVVRHMIREMKKEAKQCDRAKRGERDGEGNLYEYPLYQKVGSNHPLTECGMGENCAGWCIRYLKLVNPEISGTKSIPKKVAGKGCIIS